MNEKDEKDIHSLNEAVERTAKNHSVHYVFHVGTEGARQPDEIDQTEGFPDLTVSFPHPRYSRSDMEAALRGRKTGRQYPHTHDFFILLIVLAGDMAVCIDEEWLRVTPDDVLLLAPDALTQFLIPDGSRVVFLNLSAAIMQNVLMPSVCEDTRFYKFYRNLSCRDEHPRFLFFQNVMNHNAIRFITARCLT